MNRRLGFIFIYGKKSKGVTFRLLKEYLCAMTIIKQFSSMKKNETLL